MPMGEVFPPRGRRASYHLKNSKAISKLPRNSPARRQKPRHFPQLPSRLVCFPSFFHAYIQKHRLKFQTTVAVLLLGERFKEKEARMAGKNQQPVKPEPQRRPPGKATGASVRLLGEK